jgi:hypothetical protein
MSMANNAEAIGQLLASNALMNGERELLQRRNNTAAETPKTSEQQVASPISHDARAVSAVLLTLLDERLQASDAAILAAKGRTAGPRFGSGEAAASLKAISAKYAEDGLVSQAETVRPEPAPAADHGQLRQAPSMVSPDLQTFIQRFVAFATGPTERNGEVHSRAPGSGGEPRPANALSIARIAIFILVAWWLGVLFVQWFAK